MHVIIIGGGPTGLTLGQALKKKNISFKIFEKSNGILRTRNWAVTIGWAMPYLSQILPSTTLDRLPSCEVNPFSNDMSNLPLAIRTRNGKTGDIIAETPFPDVKEISIEKFKGLLSEGLNVEYGKSLESLDLTSEPGTVTAHFADGTVETGDVVIGTDGAQSAVRRWLMPAGEAESEILPFAMMNFTTSYPAATASYLRDHLDPLVDINYHPDGLYFRTCFLDVPDEDDPSTWVFQVLATWPIRKEEDYDNDEADRLARLKKTFLSSTWREPLRTAISAIPDTTTVHKDSLKIWRARKWNNHNGRVTLAGDAAHAMTFHRGQGANNAINDAFALAEALKMVQDGESPLGEAVSRYDEDVIERGSKETEISKHQTFCMHDFETWAKAPGALLGARPSSA